MWPFKRKNLNPWGDVDAKAYDAVANAISFKVIGTETISDEVPEIQRWGENFIPEPTTPTELSPEYHAGLATRMIDRLNADEARLTDALDAEQRQHDALMASLHAELAGVRKVRAAYGKVGELLAEPAIEPGPVEKKPQRMTRGKRSTETPPIIVDHAATA